MSHHHTHPVPHLLPLKRWQVTYRCAHGSKAQHSVVLRAATEQGARAWAEVLLAGEAITVTPLPEHRGLIAKLGTSTAGAVAVVGALGQVLMTSGAHP